GMKAGLIEDGTAIGDALALAVARLKQPEREKDGQRLGGFVVVLTDGANNAGSIDPKQAAALAQAKGIPVYTIGAGQEGAVPMPVFDDSGRKLGYQTVLSDLDERTLADIAHSTGGRYFRAMDSGTVDAAFAAIDRERKLEFDAKSNIRAQELYEFAAWPGFAIFAIGFWLARPARREGQSCGGNIRSCSPSFHRRWASCGGYSDGRGARWKRRATPTSAGCGQTAMASRSTTQPRVTAGAGG